MNAEIRATEEQAALDWSKTSGYPYFDTRDMTTQDLKSPLTLDELRKYQVAPLHTFSEHSIELGLSQQTNAAKLPELQKAHPHLQMTFKAVSGAGLASILSSIYLQSFQAELGGDFAAFGQKLASQAPKEAFHLIAQLALLMRASDIHIEPQEGDARIRFRIDGTLHPITTAHTEAYKVFLADLQTRAEIKWGSDQPQSGRITYRLISPDAEEVDINMRIETIPVFHGEEIVVRLFSTEPEFLHLENMGFSDIQLSTLRRITKVQNGMVLTVGPTGSGKTSTLYAIINELNNPETKIVTLEDPVEYDLEGISQVPIHSDDKELFAQKLRAVLREDPNVIMIGEIRDLDTARTALQAALTGHLVLSTFHASSAATAISRLMDMIGNNPLLPSALHLIQAQRLVRHICPHCVEEYQPDAKSLKIIEDSLSNLQQNKPNLANIKLKRGKGCPDCHGIGYLGRLGIIEQLVVSDAIQELMGSVGKTTAQDIEQQAIKDGMITLMQDAMLKVLAGQTTLDEVLTIADL